MKVTVNSGCYLPNTITTGVKLGRKQYTIAFDIQPIGEDGVEYYQWTEAVFDPGIPDYNELVAALVTGRYSSHQMQALINNHLLEDGNEEHEKEWQEMQMWRAESKKRAKEILAEIEAM
jgi:hypothetical protein